MATHYDTRLFTFDVPLIFFCCVYIYMANYSEQIWLIDGTIANTCCTVSSCYSMVNFLQNNNNKHPIVYPWVWHIRCFLRVQICWKFYIHQGSTVCNIGVLNHAMMGLKWITSININFFFSISIFLCAFIKPNVMPMLTFFLFLYIWSRSLSYQNIYQFIHDWKLMTTFHEYTQIKFSQIQNLSDINTVQYK